METNELNKVTLDLHSYNRLKEFERAFNSSKVISYSYWGEEYKFLEVNDVVLALELANQKLQEKVDELKKPKKEELTIDDIKNMNLISLIKWKLKSK